MSKQIIVTMKKAEFKVMVNAVEGEAIEANNTTSFKITETKGLQFLIDIGADAGNPAIQVIKANPKEVIEYAKRTGAKAVNGFSVKVGGEIVYNLYILSNGAVAVENLFTQLADIAGHAVAEAGFLRTSIKKLQQFAHAVRQNIAAYKNSYGDLTEEQKIWMRDNTLSFEQELEVAKTKVALQRGENLREGQNNDNE